MCCCICKKEIDIKNRDIPATWYGAYDIDVLKKVICSDCIKTSKDWWKDAKKN